MTNPLVKEFFNIVYRKPGRTLVKVAKKSGVHRVTFGVWRRSGNPTVPNLQAALNSCGYELVIRKKRSTGEKHGA